jgi:hypothetical protein
MTWHSPKEDKSLKSSKSVDKVCGYTRGKRPMKLLEGKAASGVNCKRLRTYDLLLENITRVRLGLAENEAVILLGFPENRLGLAENSLRTSGCARIQ